MDIRFARMAVALLMLCGCRAANLQSNAAQQLSNREDPIPINPQFQGQVAGAANPALAQSGELNRGTVQPVGQTTTQDIAGATLNRAHTAFSAGRMDEAKTLYEIVLQQRPGDPEAHHRLAVIADNRKDFASAEQHYLAAMRGKPGDATIKSDLGYSYWMQGRYAESETYLQAAIQADPALAQAKLNLGLLRATQGDYYGALGMFRQAVSETDAMAKINELFPNGPPAGTAPNSALNQIAANNVQSTVPPNGLLPQPVVPNNINQIAATQPMDGSVSEQTLRLKAMMEQARRDTLAKRRANTMVNSNAVATNWNPGTANSISQPSTTSSNPAAPAIQLGTPQLEPVPTSPSVPTRSVGQAGVDLNQLRSSRIPDRALNGVFSQIDASGPRGQIQAPSPHSTSSSFATIPQNQRAAVSATGVIPSGTPPSQMLATPQPSLQNGQLASPPITLPLTNRTLAQTNQSTVGSETQANYQQPTQNGYSPSPWGPTGQGQPQPVQTIQPMGYSIQSPGPNRSTNPSPINEAARAATYMGMEAGGGQMFPTPRQGSAPMPQNGSPAGSLQANTPQPTAVEADPLAVYKNQIRQHEQEFQQLQQNLPLPTGLPAHHAR